MVTPGCGSVWLERLVWDQEVAGSNPVTPIITYARVAQLVEHDLAKVGVAGSNPVVRSTKPRPPDIDPAGFFMPLAYSGQIPAYRTRSPCSRDTSAAGSPPMAGALQRLVNLPVPAG